MALYTSKPGTFMSGSLARSSHFLTASLASRSGSFFASSICWSVNWPPCPQKLVNVVFFLEGHISTHLILQRPLACFAQRFVVAGFGSSQVSLGDDVRAYQLGHLVAEPELTKVTLSQYLMAASSHISPVWRNHLGHVLGSGYEPADIMQEGSKDDFMVMSVKLALSCKVCTL